MATIDIETTELAGLGLTAKEDVLVLCSKQGPFIRYSLVMPPGVLIRSTKTPDPDQPFPGNRKVERGRAQKFADYLKVNAQSAHGWTCPPHQLRAHPSDIEFKKWVQEQTGLAIVAIEKFRNWDIQDGQHRILGFNLFNDQMQQRVDDLRKLVTKSERNGDEPEVTKKLKRELRDADTTRRAILEDSMVEVVIVVAEESAHRQMFADIAMHAKGINPDFATVLDQRDPVHRIATDLMAGYSPLDGMVNDGQAGRTSSKSEHLFGAKSLADLCHGVIVGPGRVGKRVRDEIERNERLWADRIKDFLNALFESFPDLQRLRRDEIDAPTLRSESLLGSATMLRVLAIAWHELAYSEEDAKSVGEIKAFFAELEPHMRCFEDVEVENSKGETITRKGLSATHPLWGPTGMFQHGNRAPSARQGDVNQFGRTVAGWGRKGIPTA